MASQTNQWESSPARAMMNTLNEIQILLSKISILLVALASATSTYTVLPTVSGTPSISPNSALQDVFSPLEVDSYVRAQAAQNSINQQVVSCIVSHESQDGVHMVGNEPNGSVSYGYWQINNRNTDFDYSCAMDLQCSTAWAMQEIVAGHISKWTTYHDFCSQYPVYAH